MKKFRNHFSQLIHAFRADQRGAEAVEWIAMVAVLLMLLIGLSSVFDTMGSKVGQEIVDSVTCWVGKFGNGSNSCGSGTGATVQSSAGDSNINIGPTHREAVANSGPPPITHPEAAPNFGPPPITHPEAAPNFGPPPITHPEAAPDTGPPPITHPEAVPDTGPPLITHPEAVPDTGPPPITHPEAVPDTPNTGSEALVERSDEDFLREIRETFGEKTGGKFWDHPNAGELYYEAATEHNAAYPALLLGIDGRFYKLTHGWYYEDLEADRKFNDATDEMNDRLWVPGSAKYEGCLNAKAHAPTLCSPEDQLLIADLLLPGPASKATGFADDVASAAGKTGIGRKVAQGSKKVVSDCLNSFSRDTLVSTLSGFVPIADMNVDDLILAYDEKTGEVGPYSVTATMAHLDPEIVLLTIDGELIETTPEHPFYVMEGAPWLAQGQMMGRWQVAEELDLGDDIRRVDGSTGDVTSIEVVSVEQWMYNLTVAEAHTFFVGHGEWLVHNAPKGPCRFRTRPFANNAKLNTNMIEEMFRGKWVDGKWVSADKYPGGLAGAIRRQLATGELVGGVDHLHKGQDRLRGLERILKNGKYKNQILDQHDLDIVRRLHDDLLWSLQGN